MRLQINEYVEREILNHRILMHPHIVQFREVSLLLTCRAIPSSWPAVAQFITTSFIT